MPQVLSATLDDDWDADEEGELVDDNDLRYLDSYDSGMDSDSEDEAWDRNTAYRAMAVENKRDSDKTTKTVRFATDPATGRPTRYKPRMIFDGVHLPPPPPRIQRSNDSITNGQNSKDIRATESIVKPPPTPPRPPKVLSAANSEPLGPKARYANKNPNPAKSPEDEVVSRIVQEERRSTKPDFRLTEESRGKDSHIENIPGEPRIPMSQPEPRLKSIENLSKERTSNTMRRRDELDRACRTQAQEILKMPITTPLGEALYINPLLHRSLVDVMKNPENLAPRSLMEVNDVLALNENFQQDLKDLPEGLVSANDEQESLFVRSASFVPGNDPDLPYKSGMVSMASGVFMTQIGSQRMSAMIDTGAEICLIAPGAAERLRNQYPLEQTKESIAITGVSGSADESNSRITNLPFSIQGYSFSQTVFMSPDWRSPYDLILGQPFLMNSAASVHYDRKGKMYVLLHPPEAKTDHVIQIKMLPARTVPNLAIKARLNAAEADRVTSEVVVWPSRDEVAEQDELSTIADYGTAQESNHSASEHEVEDVVTYAPSVISEEPPQASSDASGMAVDNLLPNTSSSGPQPTATVSDAQSNMSVDQKPLQDAPPIQQRRNFFFPTDDSSDNSDDGAPAVASISRPGRPINLSRVPPQPRQTDPTLLNPPIIQSTMPGSAGMSRANEVGPNYSSPLIIKEGPHTLSPRKRFYSALQYAWARRGDRSRFLTRQDLTKAFEMKHFHRSIDIPIGNAIMTIREGPVKVRVNGMEAKTLLDSDMRVNLITKSLVVLLGLETVRMNQGLMHNGQIIQGDSSVEYCPAVPIRISGWPTLSGFFLVVSGDLLGNFDIVAGKPWLMGIQKRYQNYNIFEGQAYLQHNRQATSDLDTLPFPSYSEIDLTAREIPHQRNFDSHYGIYSFQIRSVQIHEKAEHVSEEDQNESFTVPAEVSQTNALNQLQSSPDNNSEPTAFDYPNQEDYFLNAPQPSQTLSSSSSTQENPTEEPLEETTDTTPLLPTASQPIGIMRRHEFTQAIRPLRNVSFENLVNPPEREGRYKRLISRRPQDRYTRLPDIPEENNTHSSGSSSHQYSYLDMGSEPGPSTTIRVPPAPPAPTINLPSVPPVGRAGLLSERIANMSQQEFSSWTNSRREEIRIERENSAREPSRRIAPASTETKFVTSMKAANRTNIAPNQAPSNRRLISLYRRIHARKTCELPYNGQILTIKEGELLVRVEDLAMRAYFDPEGSVNLISQDAAEFLNLTIETFNPQEYSDPREGIPNTEERYCSHVPVQLAGWPLLEGHFLVINERIMGGFDFIIGKPWLQAIQRVNAVRQFQSTPTEEAPSSPSNEERGRTPNRTADTSPAGPSSSQPTEQSTSNMNQAPEETTHVRGPRFQFQVQQARVATQKAEIENTRPVLRNRYSQKVEPHILPDLTKRKRSVRDSTAKDAKRIKLLPENRNSSPEL
ncbi:hypothetical protein DL93DRAFT_413884 [Clavulina sp. PMI_390]|nr:hypothetical protein DL93DRAFT_413884 [Clavulina sp. PMI_390]